MSKKYGERFSDFSAGYPAAGAGLAVMADPVAQSDATDATDAAASGPASPTVATPRISADPMPMYMNDGDAAAAAAAADAGPPPPAQRPGEEPLPAIPPSGSRSTTVHYKSSKPLYLGDDTEVTEGDKPDYATPAPQGADNRRGSTGSAAASKPDRATAATIKAPWDCTDLDKEQALTRLVGTGPGAFVIRGSSSAHAVLSMETTDGKMFHRKVVKTAAGIALDESASFFGSFNELIAHYMVARPEGLLPSPLNVMAPLKTPEGFADFEDVVQATAFLKLELANGMYGFADDADEDAGVWTGRAKAAAPAGSPPPPLPPPPEVPDYSAPAYDDSSPGTAIKIDVAMDRMADGLYGEAGADLPAPRDENNQIRVDVINDLYATTRTDFGFGSDKFEDFGFDDAPVINLGNWVNVIGYSAPGHVRWIGYLDVEKPPVMRCGVELTEPIGKNGGTVRGQYLFTCEPKHGVCADIAKCRLRDDADPEAKTGVHGVLGLGLILAISPAVHAHAAVRHLLFFLHADWCLRSMLCPFHVFRQRPQ